MCQVENPDALAPIRHTNLAFNDAVVRDPILVDFPLDTPGFRFVRTPQLLSPCWSSHFKFIISRITKETAPLVFFALLHVLESPTTVLSPFFLAGVITRNP